MLHVIRKSGIATAKDFVAVITSMFDELLTNNLIRVMREEDIILPENVDQPVINEHMSPIKDEEVERMIDNPMIKALVEKIDGMKNVITMQQVEIGQCKKEVNFQKMMVERNERRFNLKRKYLEEELELYMEDERIKRAHMESIAQTSFSEQIKDIDVYRNTHQLPSGSEPKAVGCIAVERANPTDQEIEYMTEKNYKSCVAIYETQPSSVNTSLKTCSSNLMGNKRMNRTKDSIFLGLSTKTAKDCRINMREVFQPFSKRFSRRAEILFGCFEEEPKELFLAEVLPSYKQIFAACVYEGNVVSVNTTLFSKLPEEDKKFIEKIPGFDTADRTSLPGISDVEIAEMIKEVRDRCARSMEVVNHMITE
nr:ORF62-2 [Ostreid herpesvirus 1]